MRVYDAPFLAALSAGLTPVYFLHVVPRDLDTAEQVPFGLWSGDEDITINVETPESGVSSRSYAGGCGLALDGLQYVGDLTDNPVTVSLSQIDAAVQELLRGLDVRLAYCEIHATSWDGSEFASVPQLLWVGIVDDVQIATPALNAAGGVSLIIRSEIMMQLTATNPAKSSDAHQRRRLIDDRFCEYASTVTSRKVQWYKE
ncbi:MAG: hypothetical protein V7668_13945 [Cereibacter changlensis]